MSAEPAHSTSWAVGVEVAGGVEQVVDALLAGDPADEDDRRPLRVDAVALEHVGAAVRRVLAVSMPLWITCTRSGSIAG